jgi:hypothetical protein
LVTKKLNTWKISTFVLILLLIIVAATSGFSPTFTTGNSVAETAVNFINTNLLQGGATAELGEVSSASGVYKANLIIQGQPAEVYITKDGKLMFFQAIPLEPVGPVETDEPAQNTDLPEVSTKSDLPEVELFVMSHCPFGTQAEKGILPVVKTLGDKINFDLKFVYYAMHPTQGEVEEQLNQYCIQNEQNDKFLDYLECFLTEGDGENCIDEIGIDRVMLETCTSAADEEFSITANLEDTDSWLSERFPLFNIHKEDNELYGIGGSPTLVINGETISGAPRDPVSLLEIVCSAFNIAPEECQTEFESGVPSSGFGWDEATSNNVASCGN